MCRLVRCLGRQRVQNRHRDDDDHVDDDSGSGKPGTPGHPGLEMISAVCPPFPLQDGHMFQAALSRYCHWRDHRCRDGDLFGHVAAQEGINHDGTRLRCRYHRWRVDGALKCVRSSRCLSAMEMADFHGHGPCKRPCCCIDYIKTKTNPFFGMQCS